MRRKAIPDMRMFLDGLQLSGSLASKPNHLANHPR